MYENLAILAAFIFLYSTISVALERTPINGAVVFTAFGLILGPLGLGFLSLDVEAEGMRILAELTLALVLFTDAANANLGVLKQSFRIPQRLLLVGLPLTILLGFGPMAAPSLFHPLPGHRHLQVDGQGRPILLVRGRLRRHDDRYGRTLVADPCI